MVSMVGGVFYLKQWCFYNIFIWDIVGWEQFYGLGFMYCWGVVVIIFIYDVNYLQSLVELEDWFLGLIDMVSKDCFFVIVGNKVDFIEEGVLVGQEKEKCSLDVDVGDCVFFRVFKQVQLEDVVVFYKKIFKYKMLDEQDVLVVEQMCFEISVKIGYNVDFLFEILFDLVVLMILQQRVERLLYIVDIFSQKLFKRIRFGCCV